MTTVLIGVDSTARSEDAIAFARALSPATSTDFVVATVVQGPAVPGSPAHEEAHATTRRMSGLLAGVEAERIRTGVIESRSPAQGLHELAAAESAALIVVGSTHTGLLGRVRPGSTGERLLSGAPCAVAVAPYGYRTRRDPALRRIGVAYDGSAESKVALEAGIAAARALRAPLQVITVIPSDVYGAPALMGGPGWVMAEPDVEKEIRKDLDETVAAVPSDVAVRGRRADGPAVARARGAQQRTGPAVHRVARLRPAARGRARRDERAADARGALPRDRPAARSGHAAERPVRRKRDGRSLNLDSAAVRGHQLPLRPRAGCIWTVARGSMGSAYLARDDQVPCSSRMVETAASASISSALTTHHWQTAWSSASSMYVR